MLLQTNKLKKQECDSGKPNVSVKTMADTDFVFLTIIIIMSRFCSVTIAINQL